MVMEMLGLTASKKPLPYESLLISLAANTNTSLHMRNPMRLLLRNCFFEARLHPGVKRVYAILGWLRAPAGSAHDSCSHFTHPSIQWVVAAIRIQKAEGKKTKWRSKSQCLGLEQMLRILTHESSIEA
jgi:hypothetical protein